MFDVYIQEHSIHPDRRLRLMLAATLAMSAVTLLGIGATIAEKLDIDAVQARSVEQSLTVILPQAAPAAPKPPPRPDMTSNAGGTAASKPDSNSPVRPRSKPSSSEVAPLDDSPPAKNIGGPASDGPVDYTGGGGNVIGRDRIGKGGCVVPPCGPESPPPPPTKPETVVEPLAQVKARAIFTPDPDRVALSKSRVALTSRRPGAVTVGFCTGANGKTRAVTIKRSFGEREIDEIARAAVRKWRFKAMKVGGRAVETCSQVTFKIEFE
ncbi:MAG: TonB family protein [Acidobacteriota bacterium]